MTQPVTTIEITIARLIHTDGSMTFTVKTPDKYSSIEVLGLLEGAKWTVFQNMRGIHNDE